MPRKFNTRKKYHVKKGDMVEVVSGNDKGKQGKILTVITKTDRVIVEGVNIRTKHQKPNQQNPQGGRIQIEMPIHISNVMPLDPKSNEPTRIGRKFIEEEGRSRWVRVSKKSGEVLDS